ncbi:unnamed protein product [Nippostrongylus brasiliensis]|uniref:Uncharacterized protein n=1 Tax=Nippostrongylus brasiliensis TaxID=27835 RepID=A0A0N4XQ59_NIPBR|nr:unnamed protein product [Nippostrongylus brasiliensis]
MLLESPSFSLKMQRIGMPDVTDSYPPGTNLPRMTVVGSCDVLIAIKSSLKFRNGVKMGKTRAFREKMYG